MDGMADRYAAEVERHLEHHPEDGGPFPGLCKGWGTPSQSMTDQEEYEWNIYMDLLEGDTFIEDWNRDLHPRK